MKHFLSITILCSFLCSCSENEVELLESNLSFTNIINERVKYINNIDDFQDIISEPDFDTTSVTMNTRSYSRNPFLLKDLNATEVFRVAKFENKKFLKSQALRFSSVVIKDIEKNMVGIPTIKLYPDIIYSCRWYTLSLTIGNFSENQAIRGRTSPNCGLSDLNVGYATPQSRGYKLNMDGNVCTLTTYILEIHHTDERPWEYFSIFYPDAKKNYPEGYHFIYSIGTEL